VTTAPKAGQALSDSEHRRQLRRALIASTIGTTIEWYDFLLYSTVTGLVFAKLFFPDSDPLIGTLKAYVIFYVGFIARPVGAAVFGHYGDRIGRKATLIATLVITGLATVAVGLVPTYDQIGIWAAIIMIVLRFIQGVGVGGEWGGSVLMSMEWAKTNANRGFIASWPQFGGPAGIALANIAVLVFSWASGDQFLVWGWRIPFLISIVMVGVGLYIRLGVLETPVFTEMVEKERLASSPVLEVLKRQPKEVILTAFARMGEQGPGYVYIAFIFTYGTKALGASRELLLSGMVTAAILGFLWVPVAGYLSDRIGRRRMYIIGALVSAAYGFVYFALLDTGSMTLIFIAVALSILPVMTLYGPQAALIAESFVPRLRYSGAGLGYQLASIIAGGPAPFIATALLATFGSGYAVSCYIAACCAISIVSVILLKDHTNKDLTLAYEGI